MTKIHVISDLYLGFNEHATEEENIPDCDLVIINGNIGLSKRSMLYAETLCRKYPNIPFVYNLGEIEAYKNVILKYATEFVENVNIRKLANQTYPKNLHFNLDNQHITCRNGVTYDILCVYGFPKIHNYSGDWNQTYFGKFYYVETVDDMDPSNKWYKPSQTSNVRHGGVPVRVSVEWINKQHEIEWKKIKHWEIQPTHPKILVTHLNPYKDTRFKDLVVSPSLIHLQDGVWISSDTAVENVSFLGSNLYANPGRGLARQKVLTV